VRARVHAGGDPPADPDAIPGSRGEMIAAGLPLRLPDRYLTVRLPLLREGVQ
jgi:hypothetical protein